MNSKETLEYVSEQPSVEVSDNCRRYFIEGQQVELWEDPDYPFGWGPEELREYFQEERWVTLYNALVLGCILTMDEDDDDEY